MATKELTHQTRPQTPLQLFYETTSNKSGVALFQSVVLALCEILCMKYAHIATVDGNLCETLAFCKKSSLLDNIQYNLQGTPCDKAFDGENFVIFSDNLASQFPEDHLITDMNLGTYIGLGLRSYNTNKKLLILAVYDDKPLSTPLTQEQQVILHLFGEKVVREFELRQSLDELRATHKITNQLTNANIAKEVATGIAHELNQPLSAINLYSEGLLQNTHSPEQNKKAIEKIAMLSNKCGTIINRVKSFVQTGELTKTYTSLSTILANVIDSVEHELTQNEVQVAYATSEEVLLYVDAFQIQQALINLFTNSIHALCEASSDDIKQIRVEMSPHQDHVEIRLFDNGSGIAKERLAHITQPFISDKGSFGIGLSLVYSIIEAHKGSIRIESEHGKGTKVILQLPLT